MLTLFLYSRIMALMSIQEQFAATGMSARETDVYLACLQHGPETVAAIARLSGQKRSTVAYTAERLLKQNLLRLSKRGQRTVFDAQPPKRLVTMLHERERDVEALLPKLEAMRGKGMQAAQFRVHEGEDSVRALYREVFAHIAGGGDAVFIAAVGDLQRHMPDVLPMYTRMMRRLPTPNVREIFLDDAAGRRWVREFRTRKINHPVRLLDPNYPIANDLVVFGEKAALFSFAGLPSAVVIENADIARTMRTLIDCAWTAAQEV